MFDQLLNTPIVNDWLSALGVYLKTKGFWLDTCSDWALHHTCTLMKKIKTTKSVNQVANFFLLTIKTQNSFQNSL